MIFWFCWKKKRLILLPILGVLWVRRRNLCIIYLWQTSTTLACLRLVDTAGILALSMWLLREGTLSLLRTTGKPLNLSGKLPPSKLAICTAIPQRKWFESASLMVRIIIIAVPGFPLWDCVGPIVILLGCWGTGCPCFLCSPREDTKVGVYTQYSKVGFTFWPFCCMMVAHQVHSHEICISKIPSCNTWLLWRMLKNVCCKYDWTETYPANTIQ